ncbi:hypothetical protein PAXRUDRAFT_822884 [Paxillus rubicundulus Ve08.2h10]|uniref:Uncharacterized protein n=1 Tax=Paxillus rubicundulus Ve08.2h10 TaxID=930991 RepID=A0A0D0DL78_9AGAM|nr:hypothetical protein PAXRUDRAFT_822884 [Paxillus rubicundulus Ve08.2h10]
MPTPGPTSELPKPLPPRDTTSPEILPSLPPSPTLLEEDLSRPRMWRQDQELFEMQASRRSSESGGSNGKGKQRQSFDDGDDDDDDDDDTVENHGGGLHEAYPPTTDAVAETRRVEETLKRWEFAERQRRKSAREAPQPSSGPSLIANVTRKASLVLSGRNSASAGASTRNHRALKSREFVDATREGYGVPLDDIDQHDRLTAAIVVHSPGLSIFEPITPENPFIHPSDSGDCPTPTRLLSRSPFADPKEQPAMMAESVLSPTQFSRESLDTKNRGRAQPKPTMSAPTAPLVPPPRPLGLPPPVTPPPPAPHVSQLKPTAPLVLSPPPREDPEDRKEMRWWHEWLCGCGEGPDRGGDNQAGRTNPFE